MKHRASSIILTSALGLGGLATGVVIAPALASAATTQATTEAVGDRVTRIKEALAGLVTDGSITQAQADEVATTLAEQLPKGGHGGRGGHGGPGLGRSLDTAATALDMPVDELRTALRDGQSLAAVAEEKGIAKDALIADLVAAAEAHLAEHVADGSITQEQADARKAELTERITTLVEREGLPPRPGHHGPPPAAESETDRPS